MKPIQVTCSLTDKSTPLPHFWEQTVGSGHAPLVLRADWQRQLRQCHEQLGFGHVRFHDILSDDMGTLMDERNQSLYSFFNADQICDFLLSIGMKPFIELSFMPSTLASGDTTVFHYGGNVTPPKDYAAWAKFIARLATHSLQRYGIDEVSTWFFEVWNEPNLKTFWTGTRADYFDLYRSTAQALKDVDGRLRVGGPATASNKWITEFLDFCDHSRVPVDFVSTHQRHVRRSTRPVAVVGVPVPLRAEPGADRVGDRELPDGATVASPARVPTPRVRSAAGGVFRGLGNAV